MRMSKSRVVVAGALLAVTGLLAACSATPGAAAVVGDARITEAQLGTTVDAILTAQDMPARSATTDLTVQTLNRMVTSELVNQLADDLGIVVSQSEVDQVLAAYDEQAGGRDQVENVFAQQGVAPSQIEPMVRVNLLAEAIGGQLVPSGTADEQNTAVVMAVIDFSDKIGVDVNPRFGVWESSGLSIGPKADDVATTMLQRG